MLNSDTKILVVDDNPGTRYSTSRILQSAGWTIDEAGTGTEALAKANNHVDMVVLDINLPDIDGFTVCRMLRERETTARIPILHLSASFVTSESKVTGLEAGADGYLTHPVEPPVLIATVKAFLRTRQFEIELRQSEARFKAVFENALTGVSLLDEHLVYVDVNPTMCNLLGVDRQQILGRHLEELVVAESQAAVGEIIRTLSEEPAWRGDLPLRRADGRSIHLEWHVSKHADPNLRLAIVSDISNRMRYESEREALLLSERAARSEAERANRLKDDFLATLSHELRTPLNAIVGWSQVLRLGNLPAADVEEGLEAIERNSRAQAQMIADLLDISRITSGKLRLDMERLDLAPVIEAALSAIQHTANEKSIRVTKSLQPDCGQIPGDASRIQQILWNLVNNAVKFTPNGGSINVALQRAGPNIEIRVSDTGQGIEPELLPKIFERFQQGDSSSTRAHGGLGLGLAIVRQLVDLHYGQVTVESEGLGHGATFIVTLPTEWDHQDDQDLSSEPGSPLAGLTDLTGTRVLLVEDDPDSRKLTKRIVTDSGAEVREASDVQQALAQLEQFQPHVLVSDLGLPGRDGFELIREVRQRGHSSKTLPAIALTAFVQIEDRRRALQSGFQIHMAKPIDPHHLVATIASLVGAPSTK
jgi:PAS domain S-box-containing protein